MIRARGRACIALAMQMNSLDQSRPLRDHSRTLSPSLRARMRKPSCLSSGTQPSPIGGHAHPVVAQSIALMLSTELEVETASLGESGLDLGRLERHDLILL